MHNLGDDKELDRLSREAAGRYTPPGAPDWNALSSELDKVMPVEEKKRRIIFWWLLPLLLAGGATAYWLTQNNNNAAVERAVVVPSSTKENTTATSKATDAGKDAVKQTPSKETTSVQEGSNSPAPSNALNRTTAANLATPRNAAPKITASKTIAAKTTSSNTDETKTTAVKEKETVAMNVSKEVPVSAAVETAEAKTQTNPDQQKNNNNTTSVTENKTETTPPDTSAAAEPAAPAKKEAAPLKPRGKGFSFGALAGVDQSTVKFKYGNNAGFNAGVVLGYHFNDKLSVHTGAIFTQKKYKVAGADFTAPKGTMISYYKIEDVNGSCNMWEFPLLARYTISQGKKNSVFASTGLSSYLMTSEDYYYRFYNGSGVLTSRYAEYYTGDAYFMSILHLSAGFESRMSKNFSLIIEPYAKLPLAGVGFGSIRLSSFGLNFSMQYRQPAKR